MRRLEVQRLNRKDVLWYGLGIVVMQLALTVGVDQYWPTIRDPDFDDIERIVHDRQAELPGRPLIVALGSSRTQLALNAALLNDSADPSTPLVLNCAGPGCGPMMHELFLTRLLNAGIRPRHVFIEIMPSGISIGRGVPHEERRLTGERFSAPELVQMAQACTEPYRVILPWLRGRVLPTWRHHAELRDRFGIDLPVQGRPPYHAGRNAFGWVPGATHFSPEQMAALTHDSIHEFNDALSQPVLAPSALTAYRRVLAHCRREQIPATLLIPPENSAFRSLAPAAGVNHLEGVQQLARECDVPVVNGIAWVDDAGFYDGHHAMPYGARQFTDRFRREALAPLLKPASNLTASSRGAVGP